VKNLVLRPLTVADAQAFSIMLGAQPPDYIQYFRPFDFDVETLTKLLQAAQDDVYMGFFVDEVLAGFFMLRGWDSGYAIPAYGVTIAQAFAGMGLATLSLDTSKTLCRLRGVERLMLKVHPENLTAKRLYEKAGFLQMGVDTRNANLIYHYDFK
jgi:[ribosomal protein S18]-alanine N-acetyltransferase